MLHAATIAAASPPRRRLCAASSRLASARLISPHLASPHLASPRLISLLPRRRLAGSPPPRLASPHLASPRLVSWLIPPRLASSRVASPRLILLRLVPFRAPRLAIIAAASPPPRHLAAALSRHVTSDFVSPRLISARSVSSHLASSRRAWPRLAPPRPASPRLVLSRSSRLASSALIRRVSTNLQPLTCAISTRSLTVGPSFQPAAPISTRATQPTPPIHALFRSLTQLAIPLQVSEVVPGDEAAGADAVPGGRQVAHDTPDHPLGLCGRGPIRASRGLAGGATGTAPPHALA